MLASLSGCSAADPRANPSARPAAAPTPVAEVDQPRFFSDASPWNRRLSARRTLTPVPILAEFEVGLTSWLGPIGADVAIYQASPEDPVRRVLFNAETWIRHRDGAWRRSRNGPAREREILATSSPFLPFYANYYSTQIAGLTWRSGGLPSPAAIKPLLPGDGVELWVHVPDGATPSPDSDGHLVVIQPNGLALEVYSAIVLSDGHLVGSMFGFTDPGGAGTGRANGRRASLIPSYAGVLRDIEIADGTIDHAIAILAPPRLLSPEYVYPALAFDSDSSDYGGPLPMGTRLALPHGFDLGALALASELGRMVGEAARMYGLIIVDRGGGGISLVVDDTSRDPRLQAHSAAAERDLRAIVAALQRVGRPEGAASYDPFVDEF